MVKKLTPDEEEEIFKTMKDLIDFEKKGELLK